MQVIILASASPQRQEYFKIMRLPFIVRPSFLEETYPEGLSPRQTAEWLAIQKILAVAGDDTWVFGADTIISIDDFLFGKPKDRMDAKRMLSIMNGRPHQAITGIALMSDRRLVSSSVESEVEFADISDAEMEWYLDSGDWKGTAGAYKIQGLAGCFISGAKGSFSNIVGLPMRETYRLLNEAGYFCQ
ncbi:MAG: Maf family protein [Treponema sp.]|jgi:septum formation protein|nr:Maf family protein [Treponema sp.]